MGALGERKQIETEGDSMLYLGKQEKWKNYNRNEQLIYSRNF